MGIRMVIEPIEDETERSRLTITLVTITSVCFAFFGVPVGPLVDGGVLKILGRHKDQYGRQLSGNTQFKSERISPSYYYHRTSSSSSSTHKAMTKRKPRQEEDDESMKSFDPYDEVGIDLDSSQIRQNEIQRLIQFATESSIIEAVNLSNPPSHRLNTRPPHYHEPSNMIELLKKPEVSLFYLTMMLMGASLNMVSSFLFIYLKQELGASSSQLIRLFGIKSLVILGHVLTVIRIFAYTVLPKSPTGASVAIGLHLLNGIAFSALWGAGVVQADELSPPSLQATSQGFIINLFI
ncbi:hypothetical protein RO3G_11174 [Rhizopus delemar RA 99-880]|uniref:Major facilitator superfamily associated domain-containing protein n=1 Tax=Rhizopus delemar (strain RA 99-880 / ATCC MYA-4621 / FGSC 9543 / NRRL 43880) TaxID=246409 RepID=I1CDD3_RHIO9|nr:hypothetical protein RO3G_11174 [Rhizopus delemar RA 99-880]|eukprot:EIE86463.1 hypothetical protein RO3G_11174 [Rhizopus delemar RA 99-880]